MNDSSKVAEDGTSDPQDDGGGLSFSDSSEESVSTERLYLGDVIEFNDPVVMNCVRRREIMRIIADKGEDYPLRFSTINPLPRYSFIKVVGRKKEHGELPNCGRMRISAWILTDQGTLTSANAVDHDVERIDPILRKYEAATDAQFAKDFATRKDSDDEEWEGLSRRDKLEKLRNWDTPSRSAKGKTTATPKKKPARAKKEAPVKLKKKNPAPAKNPAPVKMPPASSLSPPINAAPPPAQHVLHDIMSTGSDEDDDLLTSPFDNKTANKLTSAKRPAPSSQQSEPTKRKASPAKTKAVPATTTPASSTHLPTYGLGYALNNPVGAVTNAVTPAGFDPRTSTWTGTPQYSLTPAGLDPRTSTWTGTPQASFPFGFMPGDVNSTVPSFQQSPLLQGMPFFQLPVAPSQLQQPFASTKPATKRTKKAKRKNASAKPGASSGTRYSKEERKYLIHNVHTVHPFGHKGWLQVQELHNKKYSHLNRGAEALEDQYKKLTKASDDDPELGEFAEVIHMKEQEEVKEKGIITSVPNRTGSLYNSVTVNDGESSSDETEDHGNEKENALTRKRGTDRYKHIEQLRANRDKTRENADKLTATMLKAVQDLPSGGKGMNERMTELEQRAKRIEGSVSDLTKMQGRTNDLLEKVEKAMKKK